ncbi:MAG: cell division protein ZapE [Pseudomonadota bacterium]
MTITVDQDNATATLTERYEQHLLAHDWQRDAAQANAITALDQLRTALLTPARRRWPWQRPAPAPKGVYLWGSVGRGKTVMMDLFCQSLDSVTRKRSHFHRFMYDVHAQLKTLDNKSDPLQIIATDIAREVQVLCFDEFFVSDIADAMILGRLLQVLFDNGVVFVATSNRPPDDLYLEGLQRARFLPAIEALKSNCQVVAVDGDTDYRLRVLDASPMYYYPCGASQISQLEQNFEALSEAQALEDDHIMIEGRPILTRRKAAGIAWFDFDAICRGPRSQNDYIALAKRLHTVIISHVPQLGPRDEDAARRFIALVDEFYERNVNLMLAADVPMDELYAGNRLEFEFKRTYSRLTQMQSRAYLAQPHLA